MVNFKNNSNSQKGPKQNIENYRPIANLCSATKIFEKLILLRLQKLETLNNTDLTGKNQHGFKKKLKYSHIRYPITVNNSQSSGRGRVRWYGELGPELGF